MRKFHFIYCTTNVITDKIYVGKHSTDKVNDKYIGCGIYSQKDVQGNSYFHNTVRKYGYENFKRIILEFCEFEFLDEREIYWIKELDSTNLKIGYNLNLGGKGGDNFTNNPRKEDIRLKMINSSQNQVGLSGDKNPMWGKPGPMLGRKGKYNPLTGRKRPESAIRRGENSHFFGSKRIGELNPNFGKVQDIVQCPHCPKSGGIGAMKHWHFDNCKMSPNYVDKRVELTCEVCGFKTKSKTAIIVFHNDNCKHKIIATNYEGNNINDNSYL